EGEAGIGKTALLGVARDLAAGDTVLAARGGKLERDFAHGIARQLYEPLFRATPARHRRALLRGAAELSAPVLGRESSAARPPPGPPRLGARSWGEPRSSPLRSWDSRPRPPARPLIQASPRTTVSTG